MTTLVLIGPHAAGKSTLGRALARALGWPFHPELGELLLRDPPPGLDPGPHGLSRPAAFDRRVLLEEAIRDRSWRGGPRVVETWHLGNLAYAWHRNPPIARLLAPALRRLATRGDVVVQPVTASGATLRARRREPGPREVDVFFRRVARQATALAHRWGLTVLPTLWTDTIGLPEATAQVLAALSLVAHGESGAAA